MQPTSQHRQTIGRPGIDMATIVCIAVTTSTAVCVPKMQKLTGILFFCFLCRSGPYRHSSTIRPRMKYGGRHILCLTATKNWQNVTPMRHYDCASCIEETNLSQNTRLHNKFNVSIKTTLPPKAR